jgi:integrase
MTMVRLDYVQQFRDRHGKVRRYFRRTGMKSVHLPGALGSEEFMSAYRAALAGQTLSVQLGASRTKPGTVNAAIIGYYQARTFRSLAPSTQQMRRAILEQFRADHGDKRIAMLPTEAIARILSTKSPHAARHWLKALRGLLAFSVAEKLRPDDPTERIKLPRLKKSEGYLTWSEDHVAAYRARHPIGSRPRLAFELLLNTGQRRSDVVRMGRQHVRDGILSIRQQKTGTLIEIPVVSDLQVALGAMPQSEHLTFLTTHSGKAFAPRGFYNWFRRECDLAGIPHGYTAHGLRKAAATRHADCGATAHELMAWFGWTSISQAERYTKAADRRRLAQGMVAKLTTGTTGVKPGD